MLTFEFVGGRMAWLTREQAEHLLCVLETGSFQQVPLLLSGPCIILALQRDNAVLAFDSILSQTFSTESCQGRSVTDTILHKYGRLILRPTDIKQASNALRFFFNKLIPDNVLFGFSVQKYINSIVHMTTIYRTITWLCLTYFNWSCICGKEAIEAIKLHQK
ncbi:hypothetical protein MAR_020668 [Mya arenaria]|uniref:Uncharacterized protein n=1 Tax=Mya arenaria TaxID=6604 RepID=A0ABY7EA62_MYAAR|nr:hypothetical protein MAR_020668 [Mya arenaria]